MLKIFDDIIPKTTQNRIETIINGADFSWYIKENSVYAPGCNIPSFFNMCKTIGYVKTVYSDGNIYDSRMLPWCLQILDSILDKEQINLTELLRIQINLLYQNVDHSYKEGMWTTAHVDQDFDHNVLLYYVNETDGDTFLFNEKRDDTFSEFTIKDTVKPQKGRAILFDGKYYHAASNPININKRIAINFNFK